MEWKKEKKKNEHATAMHALCYARGIHSPWLITKIINTTATTKVQNTIKQSIINTVPTDLVHQRRNKTMMTRLLTCQPNSKQ